MNLFFYKDDFLSPDEFKELNELSIRRFPLFEKEDNVSKQNSLRPIRSRDLQLPAGHTKLTPELELRHGKITANAVDKIYQFLINEASIINPELATVWFGYMTPKKELNFHCDGPVRDIPIEKCVTLCLYLHEDWKEEWGGHIESREGTKFVPIPNRLVVWSRDVIHRVAKITTDELPFKRTIMATTWTTAGRKL
jgi:hypothetical protein